MSKHNAGGPAFPIPSTAEHSGSGGMSLRDWFAGMALQGIASGSLKVEEDRIYPEQSKPLTRHRTPMDARVAAAWAYELADCMIAAREATP